MEKIKKTLLILVIGLTVIWYGLVITYTVSSGETAGQIGDALDWILPVILTLWSIGMFIGSND